MFGTKEQDKGTANAVKTNEAVKAAETKVPSAEGGKPSAKTEEERKAARKASAQKMMENKKKNLQILIDYAKRMNTGDNADKDVAAAVAYLSGEARKSGEGKGKAAKVSVINEMFPTVGTQLKSVDIFLKWEKGRSEMIALVKRAAAKDIVVEYDEAKKLYTRTK